MKDVITAAVKVGLTDACLSLLGVLLQVVLDAGFKESQFGSELL